MKKITTIFLALSAGFLMNSCREELEITQKAESKIN